MKILIAGCGKVGKNIAEDLAQEDHSIVLIDSNASVLQELSNSLDVLGVIGDAASLSTLKEAGVDSADIFLAMTSSDEVNVICCLFAKKENPKIKTIARVRNPIRSKELNYIKEELGLALVINPEKATAREIARILRLPQAMNVEHFAHGRVELISFEVPKNNILVGKAIKEISKVNKSQVLFAGIERGEDAIVPNGSTIINEGDIVSIVSRPNDTSDFFSYIDLLPHPIKKVMIAGGSNIAYYLTDALLKLGVDVSIIEFNKDRCEELTDLLPKAHIICGDASDQDVLNEEGVDNADAFVSLTDVDEENIMLSLYVRNMTDAKVVTKVNRFTMDDVLAKLDIGSIVYPKFITADNIITYVRGLMASGNSNVTTLYRILNNKAEALSFNINAKSKLTGKPLMDLNIIDNLLICAIIRGDKVIMPSGKDTIEIDDIVLIVTTQKGIENIEEIIK